MNLKDIKLGSKEQWVKIGKTAGQTVKVVFFNGVKATLINGATKTITTSMDEGFSGVKKLTYNEFVGIKETEDKPKKKKLFSKKQKEGEQAEELIEQVADIAEEAAETIKVGDADKEAVKQK